jgi:hypothetical protein
MYGTLYTNVDETKPEVYWVTSVFCARRLLICAFVVHYNSYLIVNIYINMQKVLN